jgi:O-antigen/teichoic acid export membrane protein
LAVSRLAEYSILILSPIFLVRLLDVHNYGQYREFILYAMLLFHMLSFNINSNLIYFISRDSSREKEYITNTSVFCIATFLIGGAGIYLGRDFILAKTSFDFIFPLILYLFFSINMNFWAPYWLGKKRADCVFYYSSLYTLIRMSAVIATAYFTRDVKMIVISIISVEGLRFIFIFGFFINKLKFTQKLNIGTVREQLIYIVPLGIGNVLLYFNNELGKLFIVTAMGVEFLAIYSIGAYQLPIINIIRTSIVDAVFPEIIQRNIKDLSKGLELWKKTNVIYCALFFPVFIIFFYYADIFIITLFTSTYEASIPIFRIYLFFILLRVFEMTIPLKSLNLNKYFIYAGLIRLAINIPLMVVFYKLFGLVGPALATVIASFLTSAFFARIILNVYKIGIKDILMWDKFFQILSVSLLGFPVLFLGDLINMNIYVTAVVFSGSYFVIYMIILSRYKIEEIDMLVYRLRKKVKWAPN